MNESAIEKAAEAILSLCKDMGFNAGPEDARQLARAAYPHLSVWEEPTEEEIEAVYMASHEERIPVGMSKAQAAFAISKFWTNRRNAPPVDPRREAVRKVLIASQNGQIPSGTDPLVDHILAAIDKT